MRRNLHGIIRKLCAVLPCNSCNIPAQPRVGALSFRKNADAAGGIVAAKNSSPVKVLPKMSLDEAMARQKSGSFAGKGYVKDWKQHAGKRRIKAQKSKQSESMGATNALEPRADVESAHHDLAFPVVYRRPADGSLAHSEWKRVAKKVVIVKSAISVQCSRAQRKKSTLSMILIRV